MAFSFCISSVYNYFEMKKRFTNLSIYRLIATICVLQFHIFFILYNRAIPYETLLSKGVQGLTCLSGFLYSQKVITDNKKFLLGNAKKIIFPALVVFGLMALWNLIYMFIFQSWNYIGLFFDHRVYNNGLLVQPGNYYYILYIMLCYLVTPILQRNDKWSVLVALGAVLIEFTVGFFFGSSIIACSYIVGYFLGKKLFGQLTNIEEKFSIKWFIIFLLGTLAAAGIYVVLVIYPISGNYFLVHLDSLCKNILMTTFGMGTFLVIAHAFRWVNRFPACPFLSFTDKISLNVYLFNQAFMCGAMNMAKYFDQMWIKYVFVYVFTIAFSIAAYYLYQFILKMTTKKAPVSA